MTELEMSPATIHETAGPAFERAFAANTADYYSTLGLAAGAVGTDGGLTWFISGLPEPIANGVVRTHFSADLNPAELRARLAAVLARFQARGVPFLWWLLPDTTPADLGEHLAALGLQPAGAIPGMVVRLADLPSAPPTPPGLTIEEVIDEAGLRALARTFTTGYGLPPATEPVVYEAYQRRGLGADRPLRHFLARLHGVPVAAASLLLSAGVAGLYAVATLPAARGQGIGAAISAAPLRIAHDLGYRVGVLQASAMGAPVYRRLGFRDCFPVPVHLWTP
ncbi:MAG: GNAT family N-acetyltransferase [Chloroflexi bacterium]|nr:GNAT family N-acetyltransferase [Chloroflexota bacterium]